MEISHEEVLALDFNDMEGVASRAKSLLNALNRGAEFEFESGVKV